MPDAEDPLADVAGVYVVGGASALPSVARALRAQFGRRVHCSAYPHGAVAIGLAIAADEKTPFTLSDRFSRHFGVFREAGDGKEATYDTIFSSQTQMPRAGQPPLVVERRYRPQHNLGHFRFFECARVDQKGNPRGDMAPLTEVLFAFDPALRGTRLNAARVERKPDFGPLISERYSVDEQGLVTVTITDHDTSFVAIHQLGSP
jgi:molecular chaperone DnaK (HSP70)